MSLDVYLQCKECDHQHYWRNITHNLGAMAREAGIYQAVWRPEEVGVTRADQLIDPLRKGLATLKDNPDKFRAFNAENGWGDYDGLVEFVNEYLHACIDFPKTYVRVSR